MGKFVYLDRQPCRRRHHGEVLAPALGQPEADRLHNLDQRIGRKADGDPPERGRVDGESVPYRLDKLGLINVVAELPEERAQPWQLAIESLLDG